MSEYFCWACKERVQSQATICPYCRSDLTSPQATPGGEVVAIFIWLFIIGWGIYEILPVFLQQWIVRMLN